mgnify:CR=1 FL=1
MLVVHLTSPNGRYDLTYLRNYALINVRDRLARGPFTATEARAAGLVDGAAHDDELTAAMAEVVGERLPLLSTDASPALAPRPADVMGSRDRIALVYIDGDMVDGRSRSVPLAGNRLAGSYTIAAALQQARADAAALVTQVAQDRNALELLTGSPVGDVLLPERLERGYVLAELPGGVSSEVLLRRPDVLQAENQLRAANADIGAARAAFFPRLSLTTAAGFASAALSSLFTGDAFTASAGLAASLPIFDGGANRANLEATRAQRDAAVATYERTIQSAFREVADSLARRGTVEEQLAAAQGLVDAADTTVRISDARYREGAENFLSVLEAQRTLYSAQQGRLSVELVRETNTIDLYRSLGGGVR